VVLSNSSNSFIPPCIELGMSIKFYIISFACQLKQRVGATLRSGGVQDVVSRHRGPRRRQCAVVWRQRRVPELTKR